jgi:hypothetical protein
MIFGPRYIRLERGKIENEKLDIWIIIRDEIDLQDIKISIIGKGPESMSVLRKLLKFDNIEFKNEVAVRKSITIGKELSIFTLRLFYKGEQIDSLTLKKEEPSIQKPGWFKSTLNRIDPNYDMLEKWLEGKGNPHAYFCRNNKTL